MSDTRDPQSLIDAAEQAAKTSDYATAERLLREAADLQESGPPALRAELANTLNNLGVVCELTDNPVEAERCFRRAYQIAVEVLDPSHPFVTTSRKNLEDFCAANGKDPFPPEESKPKPKRDAVTPEPAADLVTAPPLTDLLADLLPPPAPATPASPPPAPSPAPAAIRQSAPAPSLPVPEVTTGTSSRGLAIGLIAVALLFGLFLARSLFFRESPTADSAAVTTSSEPAASAKPAPATPPAAAPPAATTPAPAAPARSPEPATRTPEPKPTQPSSAKSAPPQVPKPGAAVDKGGVAVVSGEVCRNLRTGGGEWRCEAAGASVPAGQLFFYTRVKSARDVVVQHRWYRGNELRKSVDLEVGANPGSGYRTYSRNTVSTGDWRVELRTKNGDVLHEERFSVR